MLYSEIDPGAVFRIKSEFYPHIYSILKTQYIKIVIRDYDIGLIDYVAVDERGKPSASYVLFRCTLDFIFRYFELYTHDMYDKLFELLKS